MRIVCAGDCGVDRYVNLKSDRAGGITLNFAVNARACFSPTDEVAVVSAIGTDPESAIVLDAIAQYQLEALVARVEGATSIQTIDRAPSGEKIFLHYEQGVLGNYRVSPRQRKALAEADVVMTTLYRQIHGFFDSVMDLPSRGLRGVDFCDLADFEDPLGTVARYTDRFHVGFFGLDPAQKELIDALETLARRSQRRFVVTLGAGGSLTLGRGQRRFCPALEVAEVVDTTGAGDCFAAAFLSEYAVSRDIEASLRRGSERAAWSIGRWGAFDSPLRPWSHQSTSKGQVMQ